VLNADHKYSTTGKQGEKEERKKERKKIISLRLTSQKADKSVDEPFSTGAPIGR